METTIISPGVTHVLELISFWLSIGLIVVGALCLVWIVVTAVTGRGM